MNCLRLNCLPSKRQTSLASGNVQQMGKAYETWDEIAGTDLKDHFDAALRRRVRIPCNQTIHTLT